eukprot:1177736-Prorocentrum_minimum.AAC.1
MELPVALITRQRAPFAQAVHNWGRIEFSSGSRIEFFSGREASQGLNLRLLPVGPARRLRSWPSQRFAFQRKHPPRGVPPVAQTCGVCRCDGAVRATALPPAASARG